MRNVSAILVAALLAGCSITQVPPELLPPEDPFSGTADNDYPPTKARDVAVYERREDIGAQPFEVLGYAELDREQLDVSQRQQVDWLREKAALMGAHAIVLDPRGLGPRVIDLDEVGVYRNVPNIRRAVAIRFKSQD